MLKTVRKRQHALFQTKKNERFSRFVHSTNVLNDVFVTVESWVLPTFRWCYSPRHLVFQNVMQCAYFLPMYITPPYYIRQYMVYRAVPLYNDHSLWPRVLCSILQTQELKKPAVLYRSQHRLRAFEYSYCDHSSLTTINAHCNICIIACNAYLHE